MPTTVLRCRQLIRPPPQTSSPYLPCSNPAPANDDDDVAAAAAAENAERTVSSYSGDCGAGCHCWRSCPEPVSDMVVVVVFLRAVIWLSVSLLVRPSAARPSERRGNGRNTDYVLVHFNENHGGSGGEEPERSSSRPGKGNINNSDLHMIMSAHLPTQ